MKLTKYEHACFVLEDQGKILVVDPGGFSKLPKLTNVGAIVITHEHQDHYGRENVRAILSANQGAQIFTTKAVASELKGSTVPEFNTSYPAGPFMLEFFGGTHAVIHPSISTIDSFGVLINESVYYPGDSFALPDKAVEILLVTAGAPWLKTSEAMDFIIAVKPKQVIPTHDAVLSDIGKKIHDNQLSVIAEKAGAAYLRIQPGETIDL